MFKLQKISALNLLLALFLSILVGCAGSKPPTDESIEAADPDDYAEIERILGISTPDDQAVTNDDSNNQNNTSNDEDELLSLLQPQDNSDGNSSNDTGSGNDGLISRDQISGNSSGGDARVDRLLSEVAQLNDQVREKNKTIADLKARIMIMESDAREQQPSLTVSPPVERDYVPRSTGSSINDSEYKREYTRAKELYQAGNRREAQSIFESLLAANPRHSYASNAQYWIGESHFANRDYRAAIIAFEKVFTYKNSNKNDYAQFMLGRCYIKLNDKDRARIEFQTLLDNYSDSPTVARAEKILRDNL